MNDTNTAPGRAISGATEVAVIGGGCFWCIEAVFERVDGIVDAESGYAGGDRAHPSYEQVSSGLTGHAEVVKLTFDPKKISYEHILELFFKSHDPTTANRQGADVGSQYRSIILYGDESQRSVAEAVIARIDASGAYSHKVVTELVPLGTYWPAEDYHQDYYEKHPYAGYCRVVIAPKLQKVGLPVEALIK